jgi:hypothetical protein
MTLLQMNLIITLFTRRIAFWIKEATVLALRCTNPHYIFSIIQTSFFCMTIKKMEDPDRTHIQNMAIMPFCHDGTCMAVLVVGILIKTFIGAVPPLDVYYCSNYCRYCNNALLTVDGQ